MREQDDNPFAFVSNFNNWLEAINTAKYKTMNLLGELLGKPHWISYPEDPTQFVDLMPPQERGEQYRQNLEDYAVIISDRITSKWQPNPEGYEKLQEIIDYCEEKEIELIFVIPPMHESLSTLVLEPAGIVDDVQAYKQWFIDRATVYDLEFINDFTADENNFYDGFHLMGSQKKYLAELIFTDIESDAIRRYYK